MACSVRTQQRNRHGRHVGHSSSAAYKRGLTKKAKSTEAGWALPTTGSCAAAIWSQLPPRMLLLEISRKRPWSWGAWRDASPLSEEKDASHLGTINASLRDCAWLSRSSSYARLVLEPDIPCSRRDQGFLLLEPIVDPNSYQLQVLLTETVSLASLQIKRSSISAL